MTQSKAVRVADLDNMVSCTHPRWRNLFLCPKASLLILLWNFAMIALFSSIAKIVYLKLDSYVTLLVAVSGGLAVVLSPLTGFIADLYVGRYRCIVFGLASVWAVLLACWVLTLLRFVPLKSLIFVEVVFCLMCVVLIIGTASFASNIVQFSVDQLPDTPNEQVGMYLHWLNLSVYMGIVVACVATPLVNFLLEQIESYDVRNGVALVLLAVWCTLIGALLFMNCCVHHWFEVNLRYQNPYSLVCKVLNYARKHKSPVCRSALTYHENELPSRIDLGKGKYGGPFTTEQVEDVKTFLRLLGLVVCIGPNFTQQGILIFASTPSAFYNNSSTLALVNELFMPSITVLILVTAILSLLNLLIIYSLCWRCYPSSLKRIGLSSVLFLVAMLLRLIIAVVTNVHHAPPLRTGCFEDKSCNTSWLVLVSHFVAGVAMTILYPALFTLVCAQSPQNMKGFMMGVLFSILGLFTFIGSALMITVEFVTNQDGEWIGFLISFVFGALGLCVYAKVTQWYTYRQRDELLNIRYFAERYYGTSENGCQQDIQPIIATNYYCVETTLSMLQDQ